jgi:hypothetical protein
VTIFKEAVERVLFPRRLSTGAETTRPADCCGS